MAAWLIFIAMAASLMACGGGDSTDSSTPNPLPAYRQQTLEWAPCDETILGLPKETTRKRWDQLGTRLQCSTMRVPMDWAQPDRSDVFVSVMRVAAADPVQRRGALLFNPGGPGIDGLGNALSLIFAFDQSNPESQQGALQLRLLDSYDMVGFSPRGVGASTRLLCATNELERFVDNAPTGLTDANLASAAYNDRKTAEACLKNPLAPHINTDATARDLDLLRDLLGEAKLNFVGYSYGTWLGSWYASLFPDKVGRMVLDSSMDFTGTFEQAATSMSLGRQLLHDEILVPYAVRHNAYFQLGASAAEIDALLQTLSPQMKDVLSRILGASFSGSSNSDISRYTTTLAATRGLDTVLKTLPELTDKAAVEAAAAQYVFIFDDDERDEATRSQAIEIYSQFFSTSGSKPVRLSEENATFLAVTCNDTHATTDIQSWRAALRAIASRAPFFFSNAISNPCVYWGGPRVTKPDLTAMKGLDVLMVQTQYDHATPSEGADRFFAQLPNARRVYVPGELRHAVFPYTDTCVDATVLRYLLGETPTQRETSCPSKPLEQDAAAEKAAAQSFYTLRLASAPNRSAQAEPPTYLDPQAAQDLIDHFKEGIRWGR